ncbi:MAG: cytidine deaminase [Clostridiales bacterium]|nr:cytidine deaminase [Clostridiales bacterium]MDD7310470.1 cytidine deaminase [Eubacteriales bacterium]MDY5347802.1 cytidine deaminase [Eubacteriales bacterium]
MDAIWEVMLEAAKAVQNDRKVSDYVEAGCVAAAIRSASGRIYTGVCVDTASTLGICAERNAIFQMLTAGENRLERVAAVMPNGKCGAPCGACRELMVQLMPDAYRDVQILMDAETGRTVTLGELTPEWWIQ